MGSSREQNIKDLKKFPQLEDTLDIWDQHLAKCGAWIMYCRYQYIKRIRPVAYEVYLGISGEKEKLSLENLKINSGQSIDIYIEKGSISYNVSDESIKVTVIE